MARQLERFVPAAYVLHKKLSVSDVCEHGFVESYYPKNDLNTSPVLEFEIEGNSENQIVPGEVYLKLQVDLTVTGKGLAEAVGEEKKDIFAKVGVVNNLLHSMIESANIEIRDRYVTKVDRNYPYRAYLLTICNYGRQEHETYFQLAGWSKDTNGNMDVAGPGNEGWEKRQKMFGEGGARHAAELIGKIVSPIFFQPKVLPTLTPMRVTLELKDPSFYMMHGEGGGNYKLAMKEAVLLVQRVRLLPSLRESHIKLTEEGNPIPYFLTAPYVTHYAVDKDSTQFMKDNVFQGRLPSKVILAMVATEAYHGKESRNPFRFQHFGLTDVCLYKDGIPYPRPPIRLDVEGGRVAEAYHHFMTSLKAAYTRFTPDVTLEDYKNGYFMISYDMSPDQMGSVPPGTLLSATSNVRLEMKFKNPLTENVTLLVYYELQHLMEINRDRAVSIEF